MILLLFLFVLATAAGAGGSEPGGSYNGREFLLCTVFVGVENMESGELYSRRSENHFGVSWRLHMQKCDGLGLYLSCHHKAIDQKWSIKISAKVEISGGNRRFSPSDIEHTFDDENSMFAHGWNDFIRWNRMMEDFVVDNTLKMEVRVKILNMSGIGKKNLMSFDEDRKKFSDVVLVVEDRKFYVSKLFLASQSTYFEALFLQDSAKSEIRLSDVDGQDFQNFLELLHGESPLDDSTVDGIVHLADMYNATMAKQKCEQFLMTNSGKESEEKLKLAHRFNLGNLREHCLSKITSETEIRSLVKNGTREMDPVVVEAIVQKLLDISAEFKLSVSRSMFVSKSFPSIPTAENVTAMEPFAVGELLQKSQKSYAESMWSIVFSMCASLLALIFALLL